jgi:hypothetical protein
MVAGCAKAHMNNNEEGFMGQLWGGKKGHKRVLRRDQEEDGAAQPNAKGGKST